MSAYRWNENKYDVIYCDLDGTLLDDTERHYMCYVDIVQLYGGKCISKKEYWYDKRNKIKRDVLLAKTEFKGTYDVYLNEWNKRIEDKKYLKLEVLHSNTLVALEWMKKNSKKIVLVSMRQSKEKLCWQLKQLEIIDYFDEIITGDATKNQDKKDLISVASGKYLVVGDTEAEERLARKIGARWCAVSSGLRDEKYLKDADWIIDDIGDIKVCI